MKVIHVVESMDQGAVENWLARMFRHGKEGRKELDWTFYCELQSEGRLEPEIRSLGGKVIHSPVPIGNKVPFIRALRQTLKEGRYDVLHCHHDLVSAVYLSASVGLPIGRRIVHVHNADERVRAVSAWKQKCLRLLMRRICFFLADRVVGISQHTLDTFLNGRERRAGRDIVHYYGVDTRPFQLARAERAGFRRSLGLPESSLILLFAGRFVPEKNPMFALDVFAEMRRLNPSVAGVFVGDGSLKAALIERAEALGLTENCCFPGWRDDVPEIMACCDWFILPRPEEPLEGLGLAVVEAQLAGLRLLLSRGIPDDPLLPTACYVRLSLDAGAGSWARSAMEMLERARPDKEAAIEALEKSPFDMDFAERDLTALLG